MSESQSVVSVSPPLPQQNAPKLIEPEKVIAVSSWKRDFKVDPFNDKKTLAFNTFAKEGVGILSFVCQEKRIQLAWLYALQGKGVFPELALIFRLDDEPTFNQKWLWADLSPVLYLPKDDTELFLISMVGKSKLAVKTNNIVVDMYAVFDITGFNEAYNEIKAACPPQ